MHVRLTLVSSPAVHVPAELQQPCNLGSCCCALFQILDETSVAIAALEAQQWAASNERSMEYAATCAGKAAAALAGSAPDGVTARAEAVPPAGGASDVGAALCAYAEEHKVGQGTIWLRRLGQGGRGPGVPTCLRSMPLGPTSMQQVVALSTRCFKTG